MNILQMCSNTFSPPDVILQGFCKIPSFHFTFFKVKYRLYSKHFFLNLFKWTELKSNFFHQQKTLDTFTLEIRIFTNALFWRFILPVKVEHSVCLVYKIQHDSAFYCDNYVAWSVFLFYNIYKKLHISNLSRWKY